MIARHEKQAVQAGIGFGVAVVGAVLCVALSFAMNKPPLFLWLLLAVGFVICCLATVLLYCRAILCLAKAKGYSSALFTSAFVGPTLALFVMYFKGAQWTLMGCALLGPLLPLVIAFMLPDASNPAREQEEAKFPGVRCVQCNGRIPVTVKLCPHCGWTQPACDVVSAGPKPVAASTSPAGSPSPS